MDHERCEQCGFDGGRYDSPALLAALRDLGPQWRTLVAGAGDELRARPGPEVWSAIEYAAHSRDITALHRVGVEQALTVDEPVFDAFADGVVIEPTRLDDPATVVDELDAEAQLLAQLADDAGPDAWSRGLTLGEERHDVRALLEHALHDSTHHLDDVERGLRGLR